MTPLQALSIAVMQGASELFPVSSLGHAVLLPAVLGWRIDEGGTVFLPFLVMLHVGTAVALLAYFWRDWWALVRGVLGLDQSARVRASRRLLGLMVVATVPAVILGGLLEHRLRALFGAPVLVAGFLILNGILLFASERLRRRRAVRGLAEMTVIDAWVIGMWQCLALIPGFSRSGATIAGGLLRGIEHEAAAHFSFLIAVPIIMGATVLEVPKLARSGEVAGLAVVAAVVAGGVAWASTAFLMRYFKRDNRTSLDPFAYYCGAVGLIAILLLRLR